MHFGHFSVPPKEHAERKTRKAFGLANDLRKQNARTDHATMRVGNPWGDLNRSNWLNKLVGIMAMCLFLSACCFIGFLYSKWQTYETNQASKIRIFQQQTDLSNYQHLIYSGWENYNSEKYSMAKKEFEKALKIYPTDVEVAKGMAAVLAKFCKTKNLFCAEAQQWRSFYTKIDQSLNANNQ